MTFELYFKNSREKILKNLREYLENKNKDLPAFFDEQKIISSIENFVVGGKFVRGTLFLLTCQMYGLKITRELLDIACAIELTHSALLIQDDIIDNDYMRRGQMTIFARYEKEGDKIKAFNSYHYGISTAIVASDVAIFAALELLSSFENKELSHLLKLYAKEIYLVAVAEGIDSKFGQTPKNPSRESIFSVYKYKTARYTFCLPFKMAGIVSNAKNLNIKTFDKIGEDAGIIFQIKDDILGIMGDEKVIGKPIGSDIREDKKTLIRFLLFDKANSEDKKFLKRCFGNEKLSTKDIEKIRQLLKKYKILEELDSKIDKLMESVWVSFDKLDVNKEYKEIFKGFLQFNLERSY